jgi:hypothetical protein
VLAEDGINMGGQHRSRSISGLWYDEILHDPVPSYPATPPPPQCSESSPEGMSMAFRALQFLPIPLLVLSDQKTVVLANAAMGEYMNLELPQNNSRSSGGYCSNGVTETLYGKSLNQLGFDVFGEDASLSFVRWESYLDSLVRDIGPEGELKDGKIEVHVPTTKNEPTWRSGKNGPARRTQMTISPWRGSDGNMYFTCTLKTIAWKRPMPILESPSDDGRATNSEVGSSSSSEPDDNSAPQQSSGLTLSQKMAVLKEALIDVSEVPVFALWHDASVASTNRAGFEIVHPPNSAIPPTSNSLKSFDRMHALKNLRPYLPDFSRELAPYETPLWKVLKTREPLDSQVLGMFKGGKKTVVDVTGKCIYDNSGEFVGALVAMRDVTKITEMQNTLDAEPQRNEEISRKMLDCIPQMV